MCFIHKINKDVCYNTDILDIEHPKPNLEKKPKSEIIHLTYNQAKFIHWHYALYPTACVINLIEPYITHICEHHIVMIIIEE